MKIRLKICCIASVEEAKLAVKYGADALGLVGPMPSGPGVIPDELIYDIAERQPPGVDTFLLSSETEAQAIIRHHQLTQTNTIQLVDRPAPAVYEQLRQSLPGIRLVQVIHVRNNSAVQEAHQLAPLVDALLLDSGNPGLAVRQLGGTGRTHDWNISREICQSIHIPVFLAGGLTPENLHQALVEVEPFGVDVCSGVRSNGALDEKKLASFVQVIRDHKKNALNS